MPQAIFCQTYCSCYVFYTKLALHLTCLYAWLLTSNYMSKLTHSVYIAVFSLIIVLTTFYLIYTGFSYYNTSLEERYFHADHLLKKPSGDLGHGLGIIGSALILIGVFSYMLRKRNRSLMRIGVLSNWLEFHIFLCTLGPILILFHTAFKFGGLVAISFWSMVAVFLSGIIGRFIYLQIPRTIEGRELSLNEIKEMKGDIGNILNESYHLDEESYQLIVDSTKKKVELYQNNAISRFILKYREDKSTLSKVKAALRKNGLSGKDYRKLISLVKNEISINRRIDRLVTMQNLFKYWHVAHLPFALVMLIIMIIHVVVTVAFGFRWIF